MSLRELVSGGAACAPDEAAGSSSTAPPNPLARLANALLYEPEDRAQYADGGPLPGEPMRPAPPPQRPGQPGPLNRFFGRPGPQHMRYPPPPPPHMLPSEEEALFERAFQDKHVNPQQMHEIEQQAYEAAREMFGDNDELVAAEVDQFMREIQGGPPPPVMMGPPMRHPVGPGFGPGPGPSFMPHNRAPEFMRGQPGPSNFAEEFEREHMQANQHPAQFANEFHAQENNWVDDFASMKLREDAQRVAGEMGVSDDARLRDSEFREYADKLWKGEDNGLADEFAGEQQKQVDKPEDWAQEYADEESWGDKFASLEDQDSYEETLFNYLGRDMQDPSETEYEFTKDNPYTTRPQEAFAEAERLLAEGEMYQASLALEAVVQNEPKNSRAWYLLGEAQAECDNDPKAIAALQRCIEIGEEGESHMDALFALGVSHANELNQSRALDYLRKWIDNHPKYSGFRAAVPASDATSTFAAHGELLQRVLVASRAHPDSVELLSIVGVLYNLSREYEEGQNVFMQAIERRGDDYKLWNRLGATFANGENHQEALSAYRTAVDLKPGYVRAWVNVGTAYANQGKLEHASRFYLRGLSLNPEATHIWSYLRTVVLAMQRQDLLPLVESRNLEEFSKALAS
mmetsp:Transcript_5701/g.16972  ORF Transcript_5701/g.16972 Transcript_5701/m.16972 type:complete len:630 (+) Transcript_5701:246-2135(+)|eukprot:CAMPEP_0198723828 /NCGR_PEP_ID=MMETSP1475-20131203/1341_1 /TAXON_ID= ORGANISM="Unidentified sp., Strain CCMP1999" /NCGR_SAMPLE_ID=MMETSP1475 /ASSEMBLY_ACC=CAM_ASM_001111 /LENGTH=629 /DNA_ID=CAMNT_0044485121 /DNA_START=179 /DNA_END=2068 /DNA_ORIENTATION=+